MLRASASDGRLPWEYEVNLWPGTGLYYSLPKGNQAHITRVDLVIDTNKYSKQIIFRKFQDGHASRQFRNKNDDRLLNYGTGWIK